MATDPIQYAIQLVKAGQIQEARDVLKPLLRDNPHHIPAWLCYAATYKTVQQRIQVLEACLKANPGNAEIQQRLDQLRAKLPQAQPAAPQAAPREPSASPVRESAPQSVMTDTPPAPLPLPQNRTGSGTRRGLGWLLWSFVAVVATGFVVLVVWMIQSTPKDPSGYRHADPSEYYLYVPSSHQPGQTLPLFIGIHGSGGSGLDCWNMWQAYADQELFILLCPSLANADGGWYQDEGDQKLLAILQQVQQTVQVEPRYFLVGFSAGAQFVQGFTFAYPGYVRATSVLSAGNYMMPSASASGIPFQVIIGDADDPYAVQSSQQFANVVHQNGSNVDYWLLPGVGHTVTDKTRQLTIEFYRKTR